MREVRANGGFALVEAGALALTLVLIASILLVTGQRSRGNAQQAGSIANLHEFAAVTASYGADYSDQYWSYSWGTPEQDVGLSQYEDLNTLMRDAGADIDALNMASAQAIDIARRRGVNIPAQLHAWLPSVLCGHWVLSDYLDQPLLLRFAVSPGDKHLQKWSNDPAGFMTGNYMPAPRLQDEPLNMRIPYSSSYRVPPAFYARDYYDGTTSTIVNGPTSGHFSWTAGARPPRLGGRMSSEVRSPSQKVHMFDSAQWSGVREPQVWLVDRAKVPMLFADGGVQVRVTGKANIGFNPGNPAFAFGYLVTYDPLPWEPQNPNAPYYARYHFTRGGLKGRDYDGSEAVGPPY